MQYELPESTYDDWARNETRGFQPTERQKLVIDAVRSALDVGKLYYTKDVYAYCLNILLPSVETLAKNAKSVEGGEFGMDLYYARQYLDAQKRFAMEDELNSQLKPRAGMRLGTLVMQDLKRYTGVTIAGAREDCLTLDAKRGSIAARFTASVTGVRNAVDRAYERKLRKTSFAELCSALNQQGGAQPPVTATTCDSASLALF